MSYILLCSSWGVQSSRSQYTATTSSMMGRETTGLQSPRAGLSVCGDCHPVLSAFVETTASTIAAQDRDMTKAFTVLSKRDLITPLVKGMHYVASSGFISSPSLHLASAVVAPYVIRYILRALGNCRLSWIEDLANIDIQKGSAMMKVISSSPHAAVPRWHYMQP